MRPVGYFLIAGAAVYLAFFAGFRLGQKNTASQTQVKVVKYEKQLPPQTRVIVGQTPPSVIVAVPSQLQLETRINTAALHDYSLKYAYFHELMNNYEKQLQPLQEQVTRFATTSEYLKNDMEKTTATSSLEESLLRESRYRDSLGLLANAEKDLITAYLQVLGNYKEYVSYLESLPKYPK